MISLDFLQENEEIKRNKKPPGCTDGTVRATVRMLCVLIDCLCYYAPHIYGGGFTGLLILYVKHTNTYN